MAMILQPFSGNACNLRIFGDKIGRSYGGIESGTKIISTHRFARVQKPLPDLRPRARALISLVGSEDRSRMDVFLPLQRSTLSGQSYLLVDPFRGDFAVKIVINVTKFTKVEIRSYIPSDSRSQVTSCSAAK